MGELLEPCPFCGHEAAFIRLDMIDGSCAYTVMCTGCGVALFLPDLSNPSAPNLFPSIAEATGAWNRRPCSDTV